MANQFLRPISDNLTISDPWPNPPWWSKIDEGTPSDADFAESVPGAGTSAMRVALGPGLDPTVHTGHILRVRAWQPSGTPNGGQITLFQAGGGGGTIATFPTAGNWAAVATTITNT